MLMGEDVNLDEIEMELEKKCKSIPSRKFVAKALTHIFTILSHNKVKVRGLIK